jgi:hypothetical protein
MGRLPFAALIDNERPVKREDRMIFRADEPSQTHRASTVNRLQEGGKHGSGIAVLR